MNSGFPALNGREGWDTCADDAQKRGGVSRPFLPSLVILANFAIMPLPVGGVFGGAAWFLCGGGGLEV